MKSEAPTTPCAVETRDHSNARWCLAARVASREDAVRVVSSLLPHLGAERIRVRAIQTERRNAIPKLGPDAQQLLMAICRRGGVAMSTAAAMYGSARDAEPRRRASAATGWLRRLGLIVSSPNTPSKVIATAEGRRIFALLDDGGDGEN